MPVRYTEISALEHDFGFKPSTDLWTGMRRFVEWNSFTGRDGHTTKKYTYQKIIR